MKDYIDAAFYLSSTLVSKRSQRTPPTPFQDLEALSSEPFYGVPLNTAIHQTAEETNTSYLAAGTQEVNGKSDHLVSCVPLQTYSVRLSGGGMGSENPHFKRAAEELVVY